MRRYVRLGNLVLTTSRNQRHPNAGMELPEHNSLNGHPGGFEWCVNQPAVDISEMCTRTTRTAVST